jgi:hypothetical protein
MSAIEIVRRRITHGGYRSSSGRIQPSFALRPRSSIANSPDTLLVGSTLVPPTLSIYGADASVVGWARRDGGAILTRRGSGAALSYLQGSPLRGGVTVDNSVKAAGTGGGGDSIDMFSGPGTTADLALQDLIVNIGVIMPTTLPSVGSYLIQSLNAAGTKGWYVSIDPAGVGNLCLVNTTWVAVPSVALPAAVAGDLWYCVNRNEASTNGAMGYANAVGE